jgi:hypothetical protein
MLLDYLQPISTVITTISAFVAIVVTTYYKEHRVAKATLIIFACMAAIDSIGATFYGQHQAVACKIGTVQLLG